MATDIAKTLTTAGTGGSAVKNRFYDQLFLRIAESKLIHKQLGQLNRQIPQGEGGFGTGVVYWTRWTNLPLVTAGQGEGVPTTAVAMTATNVTGSTAQYDAAVSISDLLAYTSFGDVMKATMERLAYNAGISIDTVIRNTISLSGTAQNATGVAAAAFTSIPATGTLSIAEIKKAVRTLRRNDTMEADGGFFVAAVHPDSLYDLMTDASTGGWIDANKYDAATSDKLFAGEVGKLHGVRFLETSNGYVRSVSGVTASGTLYVTSVFGKDAFGVTNLQNLRTYVKGFGSAGTADPTDKVATAGWKTTFGAASLNSAFYVNITHAVSSTA
jgi:N4-gp56 family major capsid protein